MATTVRSRIVAAIVELYSDMDNTCKGVYPLMDDALNDDDLPALLVGWELDPKVSLGMHDLHKLEVPIVAIAGGKDADEQAEALIEEAYAKLLAGPRSLGGLVKKITPGDASRQSVGQGQVKITQPFTLEYLTLNNSLSAQP